MVGVIRKIKGKRKFFVDGKEVTEAVFDKKMNTAKVLVAPHASNTKRGVKKGWPMKNVALAVTSRRVKEARDSSIAKGVPTDFTKGGRPIFTDKTHYAKYLKAYGYKNWDSNSG